MEQIRYDLEIIGSLLREPGHIRALAKRLNINHMTVLRKIKELFNKNVLDYKEEGKNKVYFIKKTTEARIYLFMTENYKLNRILQKYPHLRNIIEKVQKDNKVKLAILFGSYAKGIATKDSDIDIYIETTNKKIKDETESIDSRVSVKIGKYNRENLLVKEIEKNHIILKGVEEYYEKQGFFE